MQPLWGDCGWKYGVTVWLRHDTAEPAGQQRFQSTCAMLPWGHSAHNGPVKALLGNEEPSEELRPISFFPAGSPGRCLLTDRGSGYLLLHNCRCCRVASVVSDSVWPHRRQPTRLPRPWDSPGKNTDVGCHFLLQCMKGKSESEVAQSCPTLATPWTAAYQAPPSMGFSRQKYWSGVPLPSPTA